LGQANKSVLNEITNLSLDERVSGFNRAVNISEVGSEIVHAIASDRSMDTTPFVNDDCGPGRVGVVVIGNTVEVGILAIVSATNHVNPRDNNMICTFSWSISRVVNNCL